MNRPPFLRRPRAPHRLNINEGVNNTSKLRDFFRREMFAAKRNGSWFRLGSLERGLYSLAMRLDLKLESCILLRALVGALMKRKEMGDMVYAMAMQGMRLAWAFSYAAVSWVNGSAKERRSDASYASFPGRFWVGKRRPPA